jgi:hypothetical protein
LRREGEGDFDGDLADERDHNREPGAPPAYVPFGSNIDRIEGTGIS